VNYGLRNYPVENVEAPYGADHEGTTAWIMQDLAEVHDDVRSRCDGKVCVTCVLDEWLPNSCFFSLRQTILALLAVYRRNSQSIKKSSTLK
jgi:hypothetical protein